MLLRDLYVSQRKLRNPAQLRPMVDALRDGDVLPPILVSEDDDGSFQIEDGHHRAAAHALAKLERLPDYAYVLVPRERRRPRFGRLADLMHRMKL